MRTISDAIKLFGEQEIKGKFLQIRINARGKWPKKKAQAVSVIRVLCHEVIKSRRQFHLIAIDADPNGLGILSLGEGTRVDHLINGRKKGVQRNARS